MLTKEALPLLVRKPVQIITSQRIGERSQRFLVLPGIGETRSKFTYITASKDMFDKPAPLTTSVRHHGGRIEILQNIQVLLLKAIKLGAKTGHVQVKRRIQETLDAQLRKCVRNFI